MNRKFTVTIISFLTCLYITGCGGGGSSTLPPETTPTANINTNLLPQVIDPSVTTALETHVAIPPSNGVAIKNKLFVFLPGTGMLPTDYEKILISGAAKGFHALGLNYADPTAVGVICENAPLAEQCYWNVRREIITGVDYSMRVNIGAGDAIITRLAKALAYLQTNFPAQGWGAYLLSDGSVDWSKVIVGGHSQGGGHAGVMAKLYAMHGACYFDSPADWNVSDQSAADWESFPNLTPTANQIGFTNTADLVVPYNQLSRIWQNMGLAAFGTAVSVDSNSAPFGGSHMLTTSATTPAGNTLLDVHSMTVADFATPVANGMPVFDPVWTYACFQ